MRLRYLPALFAALLLLATPAAAQHHAPSADEVAVMDVIYDLFDAMRAGDSTTVRAVFDPAAQMYTTLFREDQPHRVTGSLDGFANAVGTPHDVMWDERIYDVKMHVQDNLASAWTPYVFFAGDQLSHCGTNTIQLTRNADMDWKIVFLADTRRRECDDVDPVKLEEDAVRAALRHYLRGHATGDGSHHAQVFHPESKLMWMRDGQMNQRTSEAYIAGASGQPADNEAQRVRYIDYVDVSGNAAVGRIVLDYPGAYIVDFMSLLKVDGRWQIVNKIFDVQSR